MLNHSHSFQPPASFRSKAQRLREMSELTTEQQQYLDSAADDDWRRPLVAVDDGSGLLPNIFSQPVNKLAVAQRIQQIRTWSGFAPPYRAATGAVEPRNLMVQMQGHHTRQIDRSKLFGECWLHPGDSLCLVTSQPLLFANCLLPATTHYSQSFLAISCPRLKTYG